MNICVIGAGNAGQALSGYLAKGGNDVTLCDIDEGKVAELNKVGSITLSGQISGVYAPSAITTDIPAAIRGAKVVFVTTTANAHIHVARTVADSIEEGQIFVLCPGRTGGAMLFRKELSQLGVTKSFYVCETNTFIFACRVVENGFVKVLGVKERVSISAFPSKDISDVMIDLKTLYSGFQIEPNVLYTSLNNIGAILHPCICLCNIGSIERKVKTYIYADITEHIVRLIESCDEERIMVGKRFGIKLQTIPEWLRDVYPMYEGANLLELLKNNKAYAQLELPKSLSCRQLHEDIPTGMVPISELGRFSGASTPNIDSLISFASVLFGIDFRMNGRNINSMGIQNLSVKDLMNE